MKITKHEHAVESAKMLFLESADNACEGDGHDSTRVAEDIRRSLRVMLTEHEDTCDDHPNPNAAPSDAFKDAMAKIVRITAALDGSLR